LKAEQPSLIPIYAAGYFRVDLLDGITSVVEYVYHDAQCYYYGLTSDPLSYAREASMLRDNFQRFLDEEEVYVNGKPARGKCIHVHIAAPSCTPVIVYFYSKVGGRLKRGLNVYENFYPAEEASYPYHFVWWLPESAVVKRTEFCATKTAIFKNLIVGSVSAGEKPCGHEAIEFTLK